MVELYQTLMDNERAQYPRTQHVTLYMMIRVNCLCFSAAFGPTQIILRDDYTQ